MRFAPGILLAAAVVLLVVAGQPQAQPGEAAQKGGGKAQPGVGQALPIQPGGKGGKKGTAPPKALDTDAAAVALFRQYDKNADGVLVQDELPASVWAIAKKYDRNGDGLIDLDEFKALYRDTVASGEPTTGKNSSKVAKQGTEPHEEILLAAGLSTEAEALLDFFRDRVQPKADFAQLLTLAQQLGDANPETRARATSKLLGRGPAAIPALRHVINSLENPVAAQHARRCLEWLEGQRSIEVPVAAAKALAARQPPGAAKALLDYLPLADDESVVAAVKGALDRLAAAPGKVDPALVTALQDPLPLRRVVAIEVLAASGRPEVLPPIRLLMTDKKSPHVRLRAALALVQRLDEAAVTVLIDLLMELPAAERGQAERALKQLAGEWAPSPPLAGDDELSRKIRREAWAAWWRAVDGPSLLAAFRQRTLSEAEIVEAESLIHQLGDKSFARREKALAALQSMGPKVIGLLREAARSQDLEQAQRAQKCLKQILQQEEKGKLPLAAPRLLTVRRPPGSCEALLGFLPFTEDQAMKQEVGAALKHLAIQDGKADPGIVKALSDKQSIRRLAAAEALMAAGGAAHPAVRELLTHVDPQVRLKVALALVNAQDREAMPALINLLADLPRAQLGEVEDLLQRLAGVKGPKVASAKDDAATRTQLRDAWQAWWKEHGPAVDLAQLERPIGVPGLTVIAELGPKGAGKAAAKKGGAGGGFGGIDPTDPFGQIGGKAKKGGAAQPPAGKQLAGTDRLVAVDRDGHVHWQFENLNQPVDFQLLPGDRVLVAEYSANRVTERDLKGKVLWETNTPGQPINVQRLANGNTFIACYGTPAATGGYLIVEVDRQGKTVATFNGKGVGAAGKAAAKSAGNPRGAFKMPNGDMICLTSKGICVRLDATGKEIKSFNVPQFTSSGIVLSSVGNIDVTPKGHVVLMQNDTKVAEFDSEGRLIWQANVAGNRANRLANGHTLVASENTGVVELDATGKPVWKYEPPPGYQAVRARPGGDVEKPVPVNNVPPANAEFGGIEPKVVAAWEKAGAQFILTSNAALAPAKKKAADSDIYPTFKFSTATAKGVIAALPPPAAPFGVSFIGAKGKGNPVSEVPVTELAALKQLRSLDLKGAGLTDADLKTLGAMKQLESLHIGINAVTDAGLKELTGLQELHTLGLGNTNITDAGLKELAKLKQLRQLTLTGAPVSGTGVAELQKALPNLTILGPVGKAK